MGGSSKSSAATTTTSEQKTNTLDGVNTGQQNVGEGITVNNNFTEEIKQVFSELIGLVDKTLDTASEAGGAAINAISARYEGQENPNLALTSRALPLLAILSVGVVIFIITKASK